MITYLNLFSFLLFSFLPIIYLSKRFNLGFLNPISIPFLIFIPVEIMKLVGGPTFMLEDGLHNKWFNFALLMTNLDLFIKYLILIFSLKLIDRNRFLKRDILYLIRNVNLKRDRMFFCAFIFLCLFFVSFALLTKDFGLLNWLTDPRKGYQLYRTGSGHWYALSLSFLSLFFAISLLYARGNLISIFIFLFGIFLIYLLGSKGFILSFLIYFMIVLWFKKSKLLNYGIYVFTPLTFGLMLANFNPSEIEDVFKYFDYYVNSSMYYEAYFNGAIDLYYGYIWLTDFYSYIPRVLFESKPYVYGFLHVNEFFFPGAAEATNTPAFGGPIEYFADFGVVGVVLASVFDLGYFLSIVLMYHLYGIRDVDSIRKESPRFYIFAWLLAPSFLVFFGDVQAVILFFILMYFIVFLNRIVYKTDSRNE